MKHTCSYLQWNLSIDWNPVSIKYQIHKTIIKICTTLHLEKKGLNEFEYILNSPWTWVQNLLMKETFMIKSMNKTGKGQRENWQTKSIRDWSMSLPPAPLKSKSRQSQINRTSRVRNNRGNLKSTKFYSVKTLTKTSKRKLRYQVSKAFYSW